MLAARLATAAVGIPLLAWLAFQGGFVWAVSAGILSGITAWEFLRFSAVRDEAAGATWPSWSDWTVVLSCPALAATMVLPDRGPAIALCGILGALLVMAGLAKAEPAGMTAGFGRIMVAAVFIAAPAMALVHLRQGSRGLEILATLALAIWALDTGAYFSGRFFGRRPFHRFSPKKTFEGAIGGTVSAMAVTTASWKLGFIVFATRAETAGWAWAAGLGLVIALAGQAGDLFESGLKRDWGVKDSSSLLPGHGGFYDRFDSLLLAAPAAALYLGAFN